MKSIMRQGDSIKLTNSHYWATKSLSNRFNAIVRISSTQKKFRCSTMDSFLNIDVYGNILSCCWDYNYDNFDKNNHDDMKININHQKRTLYDIWHDKRYEALQDKIANGHDLPKRCKQCTQLFGEQIIQNHIPNYVDAEYLSIGEYGMSIRF